MNSNTNKVRTWSELKASKRDRSNSGSPTHSFHLIPGTHSIGESHDPLIHSFDHFQILRKTYANLRTLPTPMYRDWIACCQDHISHDIVGNTPEENRENHQVATAFHEFQEVYETLVKDSSIDEEMRSQQIQLALLNLLRTLLSKPTRLGNSLLEKSTP